MEGWLGLHFTTSKVQKFDTVDIHYPYEVYCTVFNNCDNFKLSSGFSFVDKIDCVVYVFYEENTIPLSDFKRDCLTKILYTFLLSFESLEVSTPFLFFRF
jgi:hypothetical protein